MNKCDTANRSPNLPSGGADNLSVRVAAARAFPAAVADLERSPKKMNMKMNLTFAQLPELRQLSSTERKQVYNECIHPILMRWPARFIKLLFTFAIFMGAFHLGFADSVMRCALFIVVYLLADYLLDVAIVTCMRAQLRISMAKRNLDSKTQGEQAVDGNPH